MVPQKHVTCTFLCGLFQKVSFKGLFATSTTEGGEKKKKN